MNWIAGAGFVVVAAGAVYFFASPTPADVYDIPVERAYELLENADLDAGYLKLKTGGSTRYAKGNGTNKITWSSRGSRGGRSCDLTLSPFEGDPAQTHIDIQCKGGYAEDGAAAGINHRIHRETQIERIDATLTGRQFDKSRIGSTSARWPTDGVDSSYGTAAMKAIKMDAEMSRRRREGRKQSRSKSYHDQYYGE